MFKKGIAVAGSIIADNYYLIDSYPEQGRLTNIRNTTRDVGGSGNLIVDLAKIDNTLPIKVSAIVGKGSNGRFIKNTLSKYSNIDQRNITEEGETSMTMVMDAQDSHQRTFFYLPGASDLYDESYIDWDIINADIFHLEYLLLMKRVDEKDPIYGTHGAKILCDAKKRGMKTSIDVVSEASERGRPIIQAALKYTDICTVNELEAETITGLKLLENSLLVEEAVWKALDVMLDLGVSEWVVIHSPACSYGMNCQTGERIKEPSLVLPKGYIKGANGAGDAYCSGILYAAYQQRELKEAMQLATACAACSLSETSGTAGLRSYEEVLKVYQKYSFR